MSPLLAGEKPYSPYREFLQMYHPRGRKKSSPRSSDFISESLLSSPNPVQLPRVQLILLKIKYVCSCFQFYSLGRYVFSPAPWRWLYRSTNQWDKAQNKPETLGCSPHGSFWQLYIRSFCCCFTQCLFLFPTRCIFRFEAKFIWSRCPGISLHRSHPLCPGTECIRPSLQYRTNSQWWKLHLNAKAQCGLTAICWLGTDITDGPPCTPWQNNWGALVAGTKAFSKEMKTVSSATLSIFSTKKPHTLLHWKI